MSTAEKYTFECPVYHKWEEHKSELGSMSDSIERLSKSIEMLNNTIVVAAVDKSQVSSKIFIGTVTSLCAIIIVLLLRDTDKSFHVGTSGLHLGGKYENSQKSE